MKLQNNQSGIAHALVVLLIAVILGAAGYAGWRVYENSQPRQDTQADQTPVEQTDSPPEPAIPDGFVEYKNEELGFSFAYPEDWGSASLTEIDGYEVYPDKKGGPLFIDINFSQNKNVQAKLHSTLYTYGPTDGSATTVVGFCEVGGGFALTSLGTVPVGNEGSYKSSGKEVCPGSKSNSEAVVISDKAILFPSICLELSCRTSDEADSLLIVKTGAKTFPALKVINYDKANTNELKEIAGTVRKL